MQNQTQYYDTVPLEYRKLSGWMIFFIVTQVLGMFSNLNSTLSFLRSGASLWVFFTLLVIVLQVLMLIFLGTRRREFCYFYYAIGAVNIFLYFRMFFLPGADVPLTFVQLISWALVFTAWCVYFHKSARLKYYFIWNDNENQQFLAAYEQKVLFFAGRRQRGARRKQLCLYARSTRSGGYPLPRRRLCMRFTGKRQFNERISVGIGTYSRISRAQRNDLFQCAASV